MKKSWLMWLVIPALAAWSSPTAAGNGGGRSGESVRVGIRALGPARAELSAQFGVRHDFGPVFTADIPAPALAALQARRDIEVDLIPALQPLGAATAGKGGGGGKPGGGTRTRPASQVPVGVHITYNGTLGTGRPAGGAGVKVAVLDTGLYKNHPDFSGRALFRCLDFTPSGGVQNTCDDADGHGTHVTGTLAASGGSDGLGIYGVAPDTAIGVYKVCGRKGCLADDVAAAIDQAVRDGAQIINMSLSSDTPDAYTRTAVQRAWAAGVLLVAAAGNDGTDGVGSVDYPAAYPEVVGVGSLYQIAAGNDYTAANLAVNSWSAVGSAVSTDNLTDEEGELELAAPGYAVESTWRDGGYRILNGTSMAAPHVAGLAARMWQAWGGNAAAVRTNLVQVARLHDVTQRAINSSGGLQDLGSGYEPYAGNGNPRTQ